MDDGSRERSRTSQLEAEIRTLRLALAGAVLLLIKNDIGNFGPEAHEVCNDYYLQRTDPEAYVEPTIYEGIESINRGSAS